MKEFIKKYWIILFIIVLVIVTIIIIAKRKKANISKVSTPPAPGKHFAGVKPSRESSFDNSKQMPNWVIGKDVEGKINKDPNKADTFERFKALFDSGRICDLETLKKKGKNAGLWIVDEGETTTMEYNNKRVRVQTYVSKCVGIKCPTSFGVVSIG